MTYMASCGNTPCNQYNGSDAKWFKIDQLGLKPDGSTWYQADIQSTYSSPVDDVRALTGLQRVATCTL